MTNDITVPVQPATFQAEPMMEKHSHALGEMRFYAPDSDPAEWGTRPWLLETTKGWDGSEANRLVYVVRPECIDHAWNHPALIEPRHLWPTL